MSEKGRWQVVRYELQKRKVVATFDTQAEAEGYELDNVTGIFLHIEFDPVVAWGDGKKSRYGPTYASEVRDDILS